MNSSLPLIVYGTVGARALPKSGLWLVRVKQVFGVVFLGVAIAMVSRIAPPQLSLALWAMLAIGAGVFLGAFDAVPTCPGRRLAKAAGIAAVLYGGTLVVGTAGGATDPLQPLAFLARGSAPAATAEVASTRVTTPAEFDAAVETARGQGKPILVDFTAEWCVTCKEIDRTVFADPTVPDDVWAIRPEAEENALLAGACDAYRVGDRVGGLARLREAVRRRPGLLTEPRTHRDGARSFYLEDPEGNRIQIIHHPPLTE